MVKPLGVSERRSSYDYFKNGQGLTSHFTQKIIRKIKSPALHGGSFGAERDLSNVVF